jgi:hypothetical protein
MICRVKELERVIVGQAEEILSLKRQINDAALEYKGPRLVGDNVKVLSDAEVTKLHSELKRAGIDLRDVRILCS